MNEHPSNDTLQAYLDGELSMREGSDLEAHLQICTGCAEELTQLRSLFQSIESLPAEQLKTDLVPEVVTAVQPRLPRLALGELFMAGILTLGLILWLGSSELQNRMEDAAQRVINQLEAFSATASAASTDLLLQIPETPQFDFAELGDAIGSVLVSPSILWVVVGAALALWLLGNGLILGLRKDRNA